MRIRIRAVTTVMSAATLVGAALFALAGPAGATTPPYEPDANALGQIHFYDASGNPVTGGNLNDAPFAKYAVATTDDPHSGNTSAAIFAYTPQQGVNPLLWSGEELSNSTTFPVTDPNAPAVVKNAGAHRPVATMSATDSPINQIVGDFPNTNTAGSGWENLYQIRMKTGPTSNDPKYWVADVLVDTGAGTWTLVYPTAKDNTSLTISKSTTIKYGSSTTTSTTLKDTTTNHAIASASVKLQRKSGTSWITVATKTTSSTGTASDTVKPTANTTYRWSYAGDATHNAKTSASQTVSVAPVISAHSTKSSVQHGTTFKIYGTVKPSSSGQKINLQRLSGTTWKTIGTVTIKKQKLPNGTTTVGFVFTVKPSTKGTFKYRVHKAATSTLVAANSSTLTVKVT
jgi:hypothetical protein